MEKIDEKELEKNIDIEENIDKKEDISNMQETSEEESNNNIQKLSEEESDNNIQKLSEEESDNNIQEIFEEKSDNDMEEISEEESANADAEISNEENISEEDGKEFVIDKEIKKNNKVLITVVSVLLIFILFIFSTIFALLNANKTTIISGISIKGIDVSGLTKEEAYNKVEKVIEEKLSKPFNLAYKDILTDVSAQQFEINFDINSSIETAYEIGRKGNIFENNFKILSSLIFKTNILPSISYNEEAVNSLILEIESNIPDRLVEPSYYVENNNLIISNGIDGVTIDEEVLKLKILAYINDLDTNSKNIDIPVVNTAAKEINIDTIYSEIYREAKDAYYTKEPFTIYPHVNGVDFGIHIDEAKQILKEEKESYTIPLKITEPNITTSQIGTEAFPDLLATFSTTYSTRNVNRSTNIKLASSKIDGIVLMPGETFSYNTIVGQRTAAAGFKTAAVYAGGEVTTGIGGGICQVSSTLYNSVLLSNLEIVERHNHGFNPGYVKAGTDATVSWGGPDFKFKNNRNYPIKIICTNSGGTITAKIFGLKEENDYEVEIESYITSYIPYKTITKQDTSLKIGEKRIIESGSNGCNSISYRVLKQNGKVVSKTLLSKDTYNPHNRIVAVGTKKE